MSSDAPAFTQLECTEALVDHSPAETAFVSNLGVSSWVLSAVADRDRNYYMKGGMGTTTPVGLGVALGTDVPVTVLDGDGSILMSLGTLSTVSQVDPPNLTVVVMDNSEFATTGGQPSLATETDIAAVAEDCGIVGEHVTSADELKAAYVTALDHDGPTLLNCRVSTTVPEEYPQPDYAHSYRKHRFRTAMTKE